tara:strand:- start:2154 stop:4400 length:2247 start_codon:yes stop_codon:yes gene_type:complete
MNNYYLIRKILCFLVFSFLLSKISNAEIIKEFNINGNDRVSNETIIMFSKLNIGRDVNTTELNNSLKILFQTDYFKNVSLNMNQGILNITVEENPIIQNITINGIKNDGIYENLNKIIKKIEKYPFIKSKVAEQNILLENILKSYGYYFVKLETLINNNENNSVDIIYNFDIGEIAKIKKIIFIGNKIFRDNTLRNVIISEEAKFWKFITRNKFLNTDRINLDVARLTKFYKNSGYFEANVKSTTTIINEDNQFELIFNIEAGEKYFLNNIQIINNEIFSDDEKKVFKKRFKKLKGKKYSSREINNLIDDINDYTLLNNFMFLNANYKEIIRPNNLIDLEISLDDLEKKYVERINILGNFITDEKVIRNALIVDEGDPYNELLFNKSIQDVKAKNIFKTVTYNTTENNNSNKIIDIKVEEKATGEIFAGAGTGTAGTNLSAGVKENNYLGLGIKLDTNATITEDSIKGRFSVNNPNYKNSDKSIKAVIESSVDDFMSSSGYKTNRTGFSFGTEFEHKKDFFVNIESSNYYEDLETSSTATNIIKKQEGNYIENLLSYRITYNKLDQNFQPTDGVINRFSQTLPLYSDDKSIENKFTSSAYHSINDNLILSAKFFLETINSLDDNVRVSKRVDVPGRLLRGFESGKIGPKDGSQFIGGNYASALNLSSTLPNILFENESIDFNFFIDIANVWEVDYDSSLDSNKIRSSSGIALNWFSAVGPLTFSYAIPLSEADGDITEKFRFQIGTSF